MTVEKTISEEKTVAEVLIDVRTRLNLSLANAARYSGVPKRYIEFFEGQNNADITLDVYTYHKLRAYSGYLNLNTEKVIAAFRQEHATSHTKPEIRHASQWRKHPLKNIPTSRLIITPKIIRTTLVAIMALGIGFFFMLRAQRLLAPPTINLISPADGLVTAEKILTISGQTEREVALLINGEATFVDSDGNFSDRLDLHDGLNVIKVVAIRKHGQQAEVTRRVIVRPSERPTASRKIYIR
jgi:hypothetical protein